MDKAYNHNATEDDLYAAWEDSGAMRADHSSDKPPFTIALPPPNVTGQLHLGHAAMLSIEDILIRYKKMQGHEVRGRIMRRSRPKMSYSSILELRLVKNSVERIL